VLGLHSFRLTTALYAGSGTGHIVGVTLRHWRLPVRCLQAASNQSLRKLKPVSDATRLWFSVQLFLRWNNDALVVASRVHSICHGAAALLSSPTMITDSIHEDWFRCDHWFYYDHWFFRMTDSNVIIDSNMIIGSYDHISLHRETDFNMITDSNMITGSYDHWFYRETDSNVITGSNIITGSCDHWFHTETDFPMITGSQWSLIRLQSLITSRLIVAHDKLSQTPGRTLHNIPLPPPPSIPSRHCDCAGSSV